MKKILLALLTCVCFNTYAASPVGLWKTIDDISGEAKSIISISEDTAHRLSGKVVKLFKEPNKLCTACEDENRNKPILGLTVMHGLKPGKEHGLWQGGEILDPKTGKVYHCTIRLLENGKKLQVRGYIGLPLFGRSQMWLRVEE